MLLAIDIGNTNIVLGLFEGKKLLHQWRLLSDRNKLTDDFAVDIIELLVTFKIDPTQINGCIIGSVVPDLTEKVKDAIAKFFSGKIKIAGKDATLAIETDLENKAEIGCDRLINSIAAYQEFGGNLIIIDFGTATTFDVVGDNGQYLGGVIAPGINLSLKALHDMTAKLPKIEIKKQENVIGKNTKEAMNSGVYFGYISLIEGLIAKIEKELGVKTTVILTGGLASLFKDELNIKHCYENLTLDGLRLVYEDNMTMSSRSFN